MAEKLLSQMMGLGEGERKEIKFEKYCDILTRQIDYYKNHYRTINDALYKCKPSEAMALSQYAASALKDVVEMSNEVTEAILKKDSGKFFISDNAVFFEEYSPVELAIQEEFKQEEIDNAESMTI